MEFTGLNNIDNRLVLRTAKLSNCNFIILKMSIVCQVGITPLRSVTLVHLCMNNRKVNAGICFVTGL